MDYENLAFKPEEKDPKKWVGCLVWVWDYNEEHKTITVLKKFVNGKFPFIDTDDICWERCRPVKLSEVRFVEDL